MKPLRLAGIAVIVGALVTRTPASAQELPCEETEAVTACQDRIINETTSAAAAQASGSAEKKELQEKATGPNVSENLAQSAIRDFLPRFAGALLVPNATTDLRALDFRFNSPLAGASGPRLSFQGGLTLHAAELHSPLVDSIPESIREASRKRLADDLEDGDDATVFAAVNAESRVLGRAFAYHQPDVDRLAAELVREATAGIPEPDEVSAREDAFSRKLGLIASIRPDRQNDPKCVDLATRQPVQGTNLLVGCLTDEVKKELAALVTPVTTYEATRQIAISRALTAAGFDRISELVNNQPQLNFGVEYRSRVAVVGPNEWTGRLRLEFGAANMNDLRQFCTAPADSLRGREAPPVGDSSRRYPITRQCLREFTRDSATQRSLARSARWWVAGEVHYRPEYEFALPADSVELASGSAVGFGASAGYGRYLGSADEDENDRDRVDLHVSYDFANGDDLRQSRFLAGAFYTLRISGKASGVIGLTWANKPEFVGAADRQLGANFGLTYKFNRDEKKEDGS